MENGPADDILGQMAQVADEHFAYLERDNARRLILGAFGALPWDLQQDYLDVQDLYRMRRLREANLAWEEWMKKARDMGLL